MADIAAIAARLDEAALGARAIAQITGQEGELPLAEAYEIQRAAIDRRLARGATLVGVKMGFTSEAKMIQMGLKDQIWGRLTSDMVVVNGAAIERARFIHPRVEPEVAVRLKAPLAGGAFVQPTSSAPSPSTSPRRRAPSAAILGDPIRSLIAAARLAGAAGLVLQPGWTIMLGGATAAAAIGDARSVSLDAGHLGRVGFTIEGGAA